MSNSRNHRWAQKVGYTCYPLGYSVRAVPRPDRSCETLNSRWIRADFSVSRFLCYLQTLNEDIFCRQTSVFIVHSNSTLYKFMSKSSLLNHCCAISDAQGWVCIVDASHEGEVQGGAGSTEMEPAKTKGMFHWLRIVHLHCYFYQDDDWWKRK